MSMQLGTLLFADGTRKVVLLPQSPPDSDSSELRLSEPVSMELTYQSPLMAPWVTLRCIVTDVDESYVTLRPFWNLRLVQQIETRTVVSVRHIDVASFFYRLGTVHRLPDIFKSHFIDALSSGLYQNVKCGQLFSAGKYSVLGVACKAAGILDNDLLFRNRIPNDAAFRHVPAILKQDLSADAEYLVSVLMDLQHAGFSFRQIAHFVRTSL